MIDCQQISSPKTHSLYLITQFADIYYLHYNNLDKSLYQFL